MMARTLADLVAAGDAALTVYSPDAIAGDLQGNLDHHIASRAGLSPSVRAWITHDAESIEDF